MGCWNYFWILLVQTRIIIKASFANIIGLATQYKMVQKYLKYFLYVDKNKISLCLNKKTKTILFSKTSFGLKTQLTIVVSDLKIEQQNQKDYSHIL